MLTTVVPYQLRFGNDRSYALGYVELKSGECLRQRDSNLLAGVERRAYLAEAARRAIRNPGTVTLARDLKSPEA